jgi:uncharacterized protein (DUF2132 family)
MEKYSKDPLHGITLKSIVEKLVDHYGFDTLGELVKIKCFNDNPSIKSPNFLEKDRLGKKASRRIVCSILSKLET